MKNARNQSVGSQAAWIWRPFSAIAASALVSCGGGGVDTSPTMASATVAPTAKALAIPPAGPSRASSLCATSTAKLPPMGSFVSSYTEPPPVDDVIALEAFTNSLNKDYIGDRKVNILLGFDCGKSPNGVRDDVERQIARMLGPNKKPAFEAAIGIAQLYQQIVSSSPKDSTRAKDINTFFNLSCAISRAPSGVDADSIKTYTLDSSDVPKPHLDPSSTPPLPGATPEQMAVLAARKKGYDTFMAATVEGGFSSDELLAVSSNCNPALGTARANDPSAPTIMYVNGINNTFFEAISASQALLDSMQARGFTAGKYKFSYFWNPTDGTGNITNLYSDVGEVRTQLELEADAYKRTGGETGGILDSAEKRARYFTELGNCYKDISLCPATNDLTKIRVIKVANVLAEQIKKMLLADEGKSKGIVLVPHSQGNLYVEAAYSVIYATEDKDKRPLTSKIRVVGIANAASTTSSVASMDRYITISKDDVVSADVGDRPGVEQTLRNLVKLYAPYLPPQLGKTHDVCDGKPSLDPCFLLSGVDMLRHEVVKTYLNKNLIAGSQSLPDIIYGLINKSLYELTPSSDTVFLTLASWRLWIFPNSGPVYAPPRPGVFEETAEGLKFYESVPRGGAEIFTTNEYAFAGKSIYAKLKFNGGGTFGDAALGIAFSCTVEPCNFDRIVKLSTGNSYNGTTLISDGTWYFVRSEITATGFTTVTAVGNYDDHGGSVVRRESGSLAAYSEKGRPTIVFGDTYAPTVSTVVGEILIK